MLDLKGDLMGLGGVRGVLNDDGGEGFQGALALVELMLEIYDSLVCTHDHRRTRDPDLCDEASNLAEADKRQQHHQLSLNQFLSQ